MFDDFDLMLLQELCNKAKVNEEEQSIVKYFNFYIIFIAKWRVFGLSNFQSGGKSDPVNFLDFGQFRQLFSEMDF